MKSIKNIVIIHISSTLLVGVMGCKKELEPVIASSLTPANFYNTADDLNNAVIGLYNNFSGQWGTNDQGVNTWYASLYNIDIKTYVVRSMLTTDEMSFVSSYSTDMFTFTWGSATYQITGANPTEPTYPKIRFVARATEIIDKISKNTKVAPAIKNQYLAEAYTLRAWLMYVLYDFFGPLNVRLDIATLNDTSIQPRMTKEAYCARIDTDLHRALAIQSFPDYYNGKPDNWGRVSKGVARMLLLKLYMHNRQWSKAEAAAHDIINMGYYDLLPNYEDVFNIFRNKEIIYAVPSNGVSPCYWYDPLFPGDYNYGDIGKTGRRFTIPSAWYSYWMTWSFYSKFDTADTRTNTIIAKYYNSRGKIRNKSTGMNGPIPLKYTNLVYPAGTTSGTAYANDWVVFRYAEVLLSLAEAINEQRGPADAYQYVNQVRKRAFGNDLHDWSGMTQQAFRDSILDERGRELFSEGARRQDLVRHGKFVEFNLPRAPGVTLRDTLFPIPSSVIIEGRGIVEQNPGY
jgi:starch-binding outer membrane protein, SusD/RagB family